MWIDVKQNAATIQAFVNTYKTEAGIIGWGLGEFVAHPPVVSSFVVGVHIPRNFEHHKRVGRTYTHTHAV